MRALSILATLFLSVALFGLTGHTKAAAEGKLERFYFGADLSFANEMNDCGATYKIHGKERDVFEIFKASGHNLARIRIWHTPDWTRYSTLSDVKRSIRRAKAAGLQVLLDFHYSDDWADGEKQWIPAAWEKIETTEALSAALYDYTYETLMALNAEGLMPEMVQVGNETNHEILGRKDWDWSHRQTNWARNGALLSAGLKAVRDAGLKASISPMTMLHIAQPEYVEPWFKKALEAGVPLPDLIGISYYQKWSKFDFAGLSATFKRLKATYPTTGLILVETAYPFTTQWADGLGNILGGADTLSKGYPATPKGQKRYFVDITQLIIDSGGIGVVSWAPDWVSTPCLTRWGAGSSWENATFFDLKTHNMLPAGFFPQATYRWPQ